MATRPLIEKPPEIETTWPVIQAAPVASLWHERQEPRRSDDRRALKSVQHEQVLIARHKKIGAAKNSSLQQFVVVRVTATTSLPLCFRIAVMFMRILLQSVFVGRWVGNGAADGALQPRA